MGARSPRSGSCDCAQDDGPRVILRAVAGSAPAVPSVVESEFLNLARDRVAADAQLLRGLDAAPARQRQRGADQLALELAAELLPDVGRTGVAAACAPRTRGRPASCCPRHAGQMRRGKHRPGRCARRSPARAARRRSRAARPTTRRSTTAAGNALRGASSSGGRSLLSIVCAGAITVSQWQRFSSWRTLPGKSKPIRHCERRRRTCAWARRRARGALAAGSGAPAAGCLRCARAARGRRRRITFSRWNRSSRNSALRARAASRFWCVAAITRTLALIGWWPPTR